MKNNRKNSKVLILFAASISIVVLFSFIFFHKSEDNKIKVNSQNESTIKTEELDKNGKNVSEGNATTTPDKSTEKQTSSDTKEQQKGETTKVINNKEDITVFIKSANFGSTAEILIDSANFNSSYKYYQFSRENKSISNIESITKSETTIFPAQEVGSEVVLKLLDENKKVIKELKIILNEKK